MTSSRQPLNEAHLDLGDHRILELPLDGEIIPTWVKQPKPSIDQLDGVMAAWHSMTVQRATDTQPIYWMNHSLSLGMTD